jgi:hypothetical protein
MHDMSPAISTLIFCVLMLSIPFLCLSMGGLAKDGLPRKEAISNASETLHAHTKISTRPPPPLRRDELPELSRAGAFIIGSVAFACICTMLFILALCIQRFAYCPQYNSGFWATTVFFWFLFTGQVLAGCYAAGCWLVLLRDLWGERGRELVPIQTVTVVVVVLTAIFAPFVMAWFGLTVGLRRLQEAYPLGQLGSFGVGLYKKTPLADSGRVARDSSVAEHLVKVV